MQQKIVNINLLDQLFPSVVIENAHTTTRGRTPGFVHCIQRRRKGAYLVGAWILHIAHHVDADAAQFRQGDRKSTRLNSSHPSNLVCRLLLEKKKQSRWWAASLQGKMTDYSKDKTDSRA